ncbi:helix-turn-helix transcriptional regulator [Indibacter alkaliphilus]|nr:transcriptional regulator [Indibacter alkaliphilus]
MDNRIKYIKGIHPGLFLERELKSRGLSKGPFALSIGEYPQTLSAITHGKRAMNTSLALRIEKALGLEEGTLMILQVYHEIREEKRKLSRKIKPDLSKLRPALFWDTSFENIDWVKHKLYVIDRVMQRGNEEEKKLINDFYELQEVSELNSIQ